MIRKARMIWTKDEDKWLAENYYNLPKIEIMKKLGRSYGAITQRVAMLRRKGKML